MATGYGLDDRMIGVRFPAGAGNFSLHHRVQTGSGAHPAYYPTDTGGSFPPAGREADHSPPPSVKDKVKLSLRFTKHHTMKAYWGSGSTGPRILNLGTRWRCVQLHAPGRFAPRERAPSTHWIGGTGVELYLHSQYVFTEWCLVKHRDFTLLPP
jgi:hypothetical protein